MANDTDVIQVLKGVRLPLVGLLTLVTLQAVSPAVAQSNKSDLISRTDAEVEELSRSCVHCHVGIEKMHSSPAVRLACTDCHGGNPAATEKDKAHVKPRYPDRWPSSANPKRTYTLLNEEDPEFIKFVNPGDLRIADET